MQSELKQCNSLECISSPKKPVRRLPSSEELATRGNARISDYRLIKTIGKGHYSKVKLAQDKRSGQFMAIKIIKRHHVEWLSLPTFRKILNNEVKLLQNIRHTHIINLIDWNCEGELVVNSSGRAVQIFFIVLELVEQGDLFSFIKQKNEEGGFSEKYARYYFSQMLDAIEYLHKTAGVVHRDLKPENLLVSHDYSLKIADFGLSARLEGDQGTGIHYSAVGTRQYQAPEVLEQRSYRGDRVDIFSMGVILFTMVTGAMPYLTEASVADPLYKLILRRCKEDYWDCWRTIRESNDKSKIEDEFDQIVPETSFTEDIMEAICNCMKSFLGSLLQFVTFLVNALKFVVTFGQVNDLIKGPETELPQGKYSFSDEFKDLVFDMMAFNHKQRPTLEEIKNHPWMKMAQNGGKSQEEQAQEKERLRKEVIREMTKLKQSFLVEQINRSDAQISDEDSTGEHRCGNQVVVNQMPGTFRDFVRYQYNTCDSVYSFASVVVLIGWSKVVKKFGCNRGGNRTHQALMRTLPSSTSEDDDRYDPANEITRAEPNAPIADIDVDVAISDCSGAKCDSCRENQLLRDSAPPVEEESCSELLVDNNKPAQKLVERQHQLIVNSLETTLSKTAERGTHAAPADNSLAESVASSTTAGSPTAVKGPYRRNLAKQFKPLDVQANQSSSINNWLDDQIKKESRQRRERISAIGREN